MAPRLTWEYKTLYTNDATDKILNPLGAEGWELVATAGTVSNYSTLIFKRPK